MTKPTVQVLSLGGTISMTAADDKAGVVPQLTGEALVASLPQLDAVATVSAQSVRAVASGSLTLDDLISLAELIEQAFAAGVTGVVVTQGTDTIEESAFALDLLVAGDNPVIVTGAMRNPTLPGADGPANLLASVQAAASPQTRGLGTVVVFNDEIHLARYVRKTHTSSCAAFQSAPTGPIGWIAEGDVRIAVRPQRGPHVKINRSKPVPAVALYTVGLGDDGRMLARLPELGYEGLVVAGVGGGHVPAVMVEPLARLAQQMPVIMASRTGAGETLRRTYGYPGSELDLLGRGLLGAGSLDAPKARILLQLLLQSGADRAAISAAFTGYVT